MCDSKVSSNKFYVQRKLICGEYIESQYYNNLGGNKAKNISKVGILVTRNICAMCYSFQDVLPGSEKNRRRNISLICSDFFNSNIRIPTLGGSSNVR